MIDVEIQEDREHDNVTLQLFPFDFLQLDKLLTDFPIVKINRMHAVLFSDDGDTYVRENNVTDIIGQVTVVKDVTRFFSTLKGDYTINKLDMDCGPINVFFDDDALLIISFPKRMVKMDVAFCKKIFDSFFPLSIPTTKS